MSAESVRIINAAITQHGSEPIASADDGSPAAIVFHANYEKMVKSELTRQPWKFARKVQLLTALPTAPADTEWSYTLQLPADSLLIRTLIKGGLPIDYELGPDATAFANYNTGVYAAYTYRAPEDRWAADFETGIIQRCEAIYLRSQEHNDTADGRDEHAELSFAKARRAHAQEESTKDRLSYPLLQARRLGFNASRSR